VSADSTLVASASPTRGPPSIPSTQSRTASNAGSAATTAPKPTRLATLTTASAAAFRPASTVSRRAGRRPRWRAHSTRIAAASATITDHTPPTAAMEVSPQRSSSRKLVCSRGSTMSDIVRFTAITTMSGSNATMVPGSCALCAPRSASAGSN
jgi:hypothetical protein